VIANRSLLQRQSFVDENGRPFIVMRGTIFFAFPFFFFSNGAFSRKEGRALARPGCSQGALFSKLSPCRSHDLFVGLCSFFFFL
jgi:hypothetical protein